MKHLKLFENFKIQDIPKFAIDIIECPDDKKMDILDYLETFAKLHFNPQPYTKELFINYNSSSGVARYWTIEPDEWFGEEKFNLSGIHTRGWYREDLMGHMINWKRFLELGLEDSIKYMKKEIEIKEMEKVTKKFNI